MELKGERSAADSIFLGIATLASVGRFPVAPGTVATLVWGIPAYALLSLLPQWVYWGTLFLVFVVGVLSSSSAERTLKQKDSPSVVIDELFGYLVAVSAAPFGWKTALLGFLFFRAADIWKIFPAGWVDREVSGGWGVMLDDAVAGLYAQAALWGLCWAFPQWILS